MNVYLLVDTSRSMAEGTPPKIDYAKKVAAALGYIGLKNLDRVGGAAFSSALQAPLTLGRGRKQVLSLFSFLSKLSCHGETNLRSAVHSFTNLFPHPGLVVIVSDLFDPAGWRAALEELAIKKYQAPGDSYLGRSRDQSQALGRCGAERCGKQTGTQIVFGRRSGSPLSERTDGLFHGDRNGLFRPSDRLPADDDSNPL